MDDIMVFVISAGRPMNVPKMETLAGGIPLTWVVPLDEVGDYKSVVHRGEVFGGGNLMDSRNLALGYAQWREKHCVQLSDDLRMLRLTTSKNNSERKPLSMRDAVKRMHNAMRSEDVKLVGVAPTDNAFFYNHEFSRNLFIVGDMIMVHADCPLRFDTVMTLKEDYDYTLQHLQTYGKVIRCNQILASFLHRTNRGGAVTYRSPDREDENIAYLKHKWPGHIFDNPKRDHEVLLRWK